MCGIAGIARRQPSGVNAVTLSRMAAAIRHRGPDGYGLYTSARVGLAHTRLSIIDLATGAQPLRSDDGGVVITYNGEIFNYLELRYQLEHRGHFFHTRSDTEVLIHAYEEWGVNMLRRLNGQFAFAIYDRKTESVFLARDRFGVRPLFYSMRSGSLYFASEAKALFASGEVPAEPDPLGIDEVFSFWSAQPPRTVFRNVQSLAPGEYAIWTRSGLRVTQYYSSAFCEGVDESVDALADLDDLLRLSVERRMRADVPVGAYLSGGLDSTITCALATAASPYALRSFSLTFDDPRFDESQYQQAAADLLGTDHGVCHMDRGAIARVFPSVIRHTETPLVRTAPAPMFLLSKFARERGITVVLTGEGADETFLGYDIYKEVAVRQFCERNPHSGLRPRLFDALYRYQPSNPRGELWRKFFGATPSADLLASHLPRIGLTRRIRTLYSPTFLDAVGDHDVVTELADRVAPTISGMTPMERAQYLELTTLLSPYLLASQGDRPAMAHGVESRCPFLDHELVEFATRLPVRSRLQGLHEKQILRRWATRRLPSALAARRKQPFRAPDSAAFVGTSAADYAWDLFTPRAIRDIGIFDPRAVQVLVRRVRDGQAIGVRENQAFVGVLSSSLWHHEFFARRPAQQPLPLDKADVFITEDGRPQASLHLVHV
jgi:asparagine synthase (glutamine-hydrolysing)